MVPSSVLGHARILRRLPKAWTRAQVCLELYVCFYYFWLCLISPKALIQCLAEAKDRTWEQLLEDLWSVAMIESGTLILSLRRHFANTSPEFDSQKKVLPVIGSIKQEVGTDPFLYYHNT